MSIVGQFDFCPNCGFVMRDGVCQSCGLRVSGNASSSKNKKNKKVSANFGRGDDYSEKTPILLIVLVIIFISIFFSISKNVYDEEIQNAKDLYAICDKRIQLEELPDTATDNLSREMYCESIIEFLEDYEYEFYDSFGYDYVVDYEDTYDYQDSDYYVFDTAFDLSVPYELHGRFLYINPEYVDKSLYEDYFLPANFVGYYDYYVLYNTGLEHEDLINRTITEYITDLTGVYGSDKVNIRENDTVVLNANTFVTYMDEKVISFLFYVDANRVENYDTDDAHYYNFGYKLRSMTIDLENGIILDAKDLFKLDGRFVDELVEQCNLQNNGADFTEYYTKDEMLDMIDDGELIWVYTPLGIEFGFNYPDYIGYCTFTCFDKEQFVK